METSGGNDSTDLYEVLGLTSNCNASQLKHAYKKLALRWHPDRCPGSETAKENFQTIQGAYSVLSDSNKRLLYDVGAYESDGEGGMAVFFDEMMDAIEKEDGEGSFQEFVALYEKLFDDHLSGSGANHQLGRSSSSRAPSTGTDNAHNPVNTKTGESTKSHAGAVADPRNKFKCQDQKSASGSSQAVEYGST